MKTQTRIAGKVTILDLQGPLVLGEAEQSFRSSVQQLLDAGTKNLAINLAGVEELDSSGIGALVRAFSSFKKAGGNCRCYAARKYVKQILRMVEVDTLLDLAEDEAAAVAKF